MRSNKDIDQSLKQLDEDIMWHPQRQEHIRQRLITDMEKDKQMTFTRWKKHLIPVCSVLLLFTVVTTIVLSELKGFDSATNDDQIHVNASGDGQNETVINDNHDEETPKNDTDENADPSNSVIQSDDNDTKSQPDRLLTQTEIMEATKGEIRNHSQLSLKLPTAIPLDDDMRLTAVTRGTDNHYEVTFYENDEPIPINNALLLGDDNPAEVVAHIHVQQYDTVDAANAIIAHETFDEASGQPVTLSAGMTGYQNAGTGSVWTNWNIGRWALSTQAQTNESEKGVELAKETITYLEKYMLPIPKQHGHIQLDATGNDNRIVWQKQNIVYTIDQVDDPRTALEIAVNFEE